MCVHKIEKKMANHDKLVSRVFDNIIKSQYDNRTYRGLELSNKMRVLLISDPSTDKSAAALNARVGFMSDDPDLPGLAHFCEHMLFLGTKTYPVENDYTKFLHEHSGSSNAYTAADNTCYYFDVAPNSLSDALHRFAQFFLCPLFTESATEREVNAVDSEHEKNLQSDTWRLAQLERATCDPNHDFSKFGTGNKFTLFENPKSQGINIRDKLLEFHNKFYSSNIMSLIILGKETLEELENFVLPLFSDVSNKNVQVPDWPKHPFSPEFLKLQGHVVPVKDIQNMNIAFPVPDLQNEYHSCPTSYLAHLIGHEGPGSLLSELKSLGWANSIVSGYKPGAKGFAFFIVDLELTEEGIDHTDEIVTLLFQYLALLKKEGPQEWIFNERKNLNDITFRFKDREKPQSYVCSLASASFDYEMEDILCGSYIQTKYKPELITKVLDLLIPDTIRIAVVGKKFSDICIKTEKWYGTKYHLDPIKEKVIQSWKNVTIHPRLKLPLPNEFIPTNFELIPQENEMPKFPYLLRNTKMSRLWYKQDDYFLLPKACLNFMLESAMAYVDPLHFNMTRLFVQLVRDSLNEYTYAADLAGIQYFLRCSKAGIFLNIKGYTDKQHILLQKVMDKLTDLNFDQKRFDILKERLRRELKNFDAQQPHQHAMFYTSLIISEKIWSNEELLNCLDDITIDKVKLMVPGLLGRVHIEALLYGNISKQKAIDLMSIVENGLQLKMGSKYVMPGELLRDREIQLLDGVHLVYEVKNEVHNSSAVETYYQCGVQETRNNMLLELLVSVVAEPCYNFLRTQEQLGYIVCSGTRRSNGAQGLRILVQSEKSPSFIDGKIESFIQYFEKYLLELTEEEYKNHMDSLSLLRLEKPKKLSIQNTKYWMEISTKQYHFERDPLEVAVLATITKDELILFFKELVSCDAPKRKKLSVHILSTNCKSANDYIDGEFPCVPDLDPTNDGLIPPPPGFRRPIKIENVNEFKNSSPLYPLVPPYIHIPCPLLKPEKAKL
ncbi:insulin-degrading enzyme isoform X2 [Parasteatoda tepidariorum]|uniref:insulin-degrading enzyme isoform X2 n=2 Tax=Parasteatoda tepidariorum TaxID=114398 RepID=UPI001C72597B|nr:insulin-degrading enzyme isoform X2 [Parasteatoda tepidariorum]